MRSLRPSAFDSTTNEQKCTATSTPFQKTESLQWDAHTLDDGTIPGAVDFHKIYIQITEQDFQRSEDQKNTGTPTQCPQVDSVDIR